MAVPGVSTFDTVNNPSNPTNTTPIAAGVATNTVIKATPGKAFTILITTVGTNTLTVSDANSSATAAAGTIIGITAASAALGSAFTCVGPSQFGIVVLGNAANPAVTISWC